MVLMLEVANANYFFLIIEDIRSTGNNAWF